MRQIIAATPATALGDPRARDRRSARGDCRLRGARAPLSLERLRRQRAVQRAPASPRRSTSDSVRIAIARRRCVCINRVCAEYPSSSLVTQVGRLLARTARSSTAAASASPAAAPARTGDGTVRASARGRRCLHRTTGRARADRHRAHRPAGHGARHAALDREVSYREERLAGPARVFFDLQGRRRRARARRCGAALSQRTSSGRFASAVIPTAPSASSSISKASAATASTRSTTRSAWSSMRNRLRRVPKPGRATLAPLQRSLAPSVRRALPLMPSDATGRARCDQPHPLPRCTRCTGAVRRCTRPRGAAAEPRLCRCTSIAPRRRFRLRPQRHRPRTAPAASRSRGSSVSACRAS